jgi:hypothetical protein
MEEYAFKKLSFDKTRDRNRGGKEGGKVGNPGYRL